MQNLRKKNLSTKTNKKREKGLEESMAVEERAWGEVARLAGIAHKFSKRLHAKELQVKLDLQDHHREILKLQHDKQATQERHALMIIEMYKKEAEAKEMRNLLDRATEDKQHLGQRYLEKIKVLQAKLQDNTMQSTAETGTERLEKMVHHGKQDELSKVENRMLYYKAKTRKNAWEMWRNDTLYARWEKTTQKHVGGIIREVLFTAKSNFAAKATAWRAWKLCTADVLRKPLSYVLQRKTFAAWHYWGAVGKDKMLELKAKNKRQVLRAWRILCAISSRSACLQARAKKQVSIWQKRAALTTWKSRQDLQHTMHFCRESIVQNMKRRAFRTWLEDYVFFARNVATHAMMLLRSWVAAVCFESGWTVPSNEDETMFMYNGMEASLRWMVGMQMTTHLTTMLFQRLQVSCGIFLCLYLSDLNNSRILCNNSL